MEAQKSRLPSSLSAGPHDLRAASRSLLRFDLRLLSELVWRSAGVLAGLCESSNVLDDPKSEDSEKLKGPNPPALIPLSLSMVVMRVSSTSLVGVCSDLYDGCHGAAGLDPRQDLAPSCENEGVTLKGNGGDSKLELRTLFLLLKGGGERYSRKTAVVAVVGVVLEPRQDFTVLNLVSGTRLMKPFLAHELALDVDFNFFSCPSNFSAEKWFSLSAVFNRKRSLSESLNLRKRVSELSVSRDNSDKEEARDESQ